MQEGDRVILGFAQPMLPDKAFDATYELIDFGTWTTVGSGVADADLAGSGERITDVDWFDPYRFSVIGERLTIDGALSLGSSSMSSTADRPRDHFWRRLTDAA